MVCFLIYPKGERDTWFAVSNTSDITVGAVGRGGVVVERGGRGELAFFHLRATHPSQMPAWLRGTDQNAMLFLNEPLQLGELLESFLKIMSCLKRENILPNPLCREESFVTSDFKFC